MPSAMAAQVRCTGQPSGTVSSTTRVITKSAHAASRVASPRTRRIGKRISPEPTRNVVASGAGNEYGPPGKCNLNSVLKRRTAVSFSCRKPSHLLIPDRQNGVASPTRRTSWDGFLQLNDTAVLLFSTEFKLHLPGGPYSFPAPEATAFLVGSGEILFPILLVLGLATRLAACALLVMTLVVELTVPDGWPVHLTWAAMALGIMACAPGRLL